MIDFCVLGSGISGSTTVLIHSITCSSVILSNEPELLNFIDKSQEETRIPQPWMQNGFFQIGTHASRTLSRIFDVEHKEVESKFDPQNKYATKNMERYFNSSDRTIRSVIDDISYGRIQLPDLQRPFTWRTDQTTALFDSI